MRKENQTSLSFLDYCGMAGDFRWEVKNHLIHQAFDSRQKQRWSYKRLL
jgi:hypothetical protein